MRDLRELEEKEIREFVSAHDEKPFRARQIMEWLWKKSVYDFDRMSNLPSSLRDALRKNFSISSLTVKTEQVSTDRTRKYGFSGTDGNLVEGVLIPSRQRVTACISSQIGCLLNCSFCATPKLKNRRNLTAGEIYVQVSLLQEQSLAWYGRGLSNLVFMGMGEPLLNYENVLRSIHFITSETGMGMSPRRITLSTVGLVEGINRLARDKVKFDLAVSLHTANNEKRSRIIPVNKSNPLPALSEAIQHFYGETGLRITYEYLLMKDFNDGLADAKELAEFCRITPCKINLIEYNEVEGSMQKKTSPERLQAFKEFLDSRNMVVTIRRSRGQDIDAACGQLAGRSTPHS
ncbi:Dual-specificity RNA methyltransferase RlmN [subsurface metagenome]